MFSLILFENEPAGIKLQGFKIDSIFCMLSVKLSAARLEIAPMALPQALLNNLSILQNMSKTG